MKKLFVISLGGSLIFPKDEPDAKFLSSFRKLILDKIKTGFRFILITGGGNLCRNYQSALKSLTNASPADVDWMGIYTTWTNANLVRLMFGKLAHPKIIKDPNKKVNFKEKILVAGGWKPGRSTDDDAVRSAQLYGANTIINLSNLYYVYAKDPKKFKNAKPIKQINWQDFRKMISNKWRPGTNLPFDPTAAKTAQKNGLKVITTYGRDLKNLKNILSELSFVGTVIK